MLKFILAMTAAALLPAVAYAADVPVDISINGEYLLTDSPPYIESDTAFTPIRSISEALGAEVSWDSETQCAYISHNNDEIKILTQTDEIYVNNQKKKVGNGVKIRNDRTMVPVRTVSNLLNAEVSWNDAYRCVEISKDGIDLDIASTDYTYTRDELYWLARIIHAESWGESLDGKIAVGNVVLNRRASNEFPNTIYDVIFDDKYGVQFEPISNGTIYNSPDRESIAAAKLAFRNESNVGNCLYFYAPKLATSTWIQDNREYYTTIGEHMFYI